MTVLQVVSIGSCVPVPLVRAVEVPHISLPTSAIRSMDRRVIFIANFPDN